MSSLFRRTPGEYAVDEFGGKTRRGKTTGKMNITTTMGKGTGKMKKTKKTKSEPDDVLREEAPIVDGTFLPSSGTPSTSTATSPSSSPSSSTPVSMPEYGFLSTHRTITLSPPAASRLLDALAAELGTRGGITTPFLFRNESADRERVARVVGAFVGLELGGGTEGEWVAELRYTGMHELAVVFRWALARIRRTGTPAHGVLTLAAYEAWSAAEKERGFPTSHFAAFLTLIPDAVHDILITTLSLLTRLTAHSAQSGHTPPTLAPLFGPLLFGIPSHARFSTAYASYLGSTTALEHLLLGFIRWQGALTLPTRLREWIKSYPSPARVAPTRRLTVLKRNVPAYTPDLVRDAETWGLGGWSDGYRRKMGMRAVRNPSSLTDLRWGEFASAGFEVSPASPLQFDLTEGVREERTRKRQTLSWNDFSSAGFSRGEGLLRDTLVFTFDSPSLSAQPSPRSPTPSPQSKKPRPPPFTYPTAPVVAGEDGVEEAFLDCWCDLIGGAWRDEQDGQDERWAIVEFHPKSLTLLVETVPPEYRLALASSSSSRGRLGSLFGASAPKLSVPRVSTPTKGKLPSRLLTPKKQPEGKELSPQEAEFEGMLRRGNEATKVLKIDSASEISTLSQQSHSHPTPTNSNLNTPTHKEKEKRKLKLPTLKARHSQLVDPVEFELGLIRDSSQEEEEEQDGWIDILVGARMQRISGQDAAWRDQSEGGGGGGDDPELVSLEIEAVMRGVRGVGSDDDDSPDHDDGASDKIGEKRVADEDESVEIFYPGRGQYEHDTDTGSDMTQLYEDDPGEDDDDRESEDEEAESVLRNIRAKKTPSYFDLHPERRGTLPQPTTSQPTTSTSNPTTTPPQTRPQFRPLPILPLTPSKSLPVTPSKSIPLTQSKSLPSSKSSTKSLPSAPQSLPERGKTQALIDMYRERERVADPVVIRIEEASADELRNGGGGSSADLSESDDLEDVDGAGGGLRNGEGGLGEGNANGSGSSLVRYVHGAPLHNVIEEEEE